MSRFLLKVKQAIPLLGHIAFGIIDRGTNLLQVRPSSFCPLSCIFCSVNAGPGSTNRQTEFIVEAEYMVEWFVRVVGEKGLQRAHAYIDAAGDPLTYKDLVKLVRLLKHSGAAETITVETHGALLTQQLIDQLADAGLDRINLSVDALDRELAKKLSGTPWFDVAKVLEVAEYAVSSTNIDLLVAPVWVPGLNDQEVPRIIEWALRIGAGKRVPPLGIQKYEAHKYGRRPAGVKPLPWEKFYRELTRWEDQFGVRLKLSPRDFGIVKSKHIPAAFQVGEKASVNVVFWGWLKDQWLGVARNRVLTIVGVSGEPPVGKKVKIRILRNKDNVYVGRII
jgi:uncharacterized Fe-S cluster-containing radical SAM superfamily enzyme